MAFPLIFIGLLLITVAARNETERFEAILSDDFTGDGKSVGFVGWLFAVLIIVAIGSVKPLRGVMDGFLVLIGLGLIFSNQGFFAEFQRQTLGIQEQNQ